MFDKWMAAPPPPPKLEDYWPGNLQERAYCLGYLGSLPFDWFEKDSGCFAAFAAGKAKKEQDGKAI